MQRRSEDEIKAMTSLSISWPTKNELRRWVLVPDDIYESDMEGNNPGALWVKFPAVRPYLGEEDDQLPGFLQRIHDNNWNWYDAGLTLGGITELRRVAEDFGLSTAVLEELWPTKQEIGTC